MRRRSFLRSVFTPFVVVLAAIYFFIDALVLSVVRPLLRRFAHLKFFQMVAQWIGSLNPYATLAIFLAPLLVLEPIKPLGAYLIVEGHFVGGTLLLIFGELLKIMIVERIFHIGRPQLMTIPPFARTYDFVGGWLAWLQALPPWQMIKRTFAELKYQMRKLKRRGLRSA